MVRAANPVSFANIAVGMKETACRLPAPQVGRVFRAVIFIAIPSAKDSERVRQETRKWHMIETDRVATADGIILADC